MNSTAVGTLLERMMVGTAPIAAGSPERHEQTDLEFRQRQQPERGPGHDADVPPSRR
jgi:hypothetical protein